MNKQSKAAHQPHGKDSGKSKPTAPAGPSMSADHKPVSENDNSANLFEDHIRDEKKES